MNILLIGPLPPPVGGATVLFQQLVAELTMHPDVDITIVRTNPKNPGKLKKVFHQLLTMCCIIAKVHRADVVAFHASISGGYKFSPIIRLVCLVARKPWVFRGFGGNYSKWYAESPTWRRALFRNSAMLANTVLLETKESVSFFGQLCRKWNVEWYPNSRPIEKSKKAVTDDESTKSTLARRLTRFVYLGHVQPSKGVLVLREASEQLTSNVSIDVYGPLLAGLDAASIDGKNIMYRGVLNPSEVARTLENYDVLVFPTMYVGEGYPGVILEAYSRGLPVITTRFRAIPEIVDESSGVLVEPGNAIDLATAMDAVARDAGLLASLRDGAQQKAKLFESSAWTARFVKICAELVGTLDT